MKKRFLTLNLCAEHPLICSFVAVFLLTLTSAFSMWRGGEFYYLDTDCYTRFLRITDWLNGDFSWFEKIFPFTNCPEGEVLHFTRINDVIWLIFSLPFMLFLPLKEAVFAGGMIFSPFMFFLVLTLLMLSMRRFLGKADFAKPSLFIFAFFVIFLSKSMVFEFGRPDHHSLMLLIATILGSALLLPTEKNMFLGGIAAATGIWASSAFEGMLLAYVVLAVLCVGIIFYKHSFNYAFYYTLGLFVGVAAAYALNPPFEGYFHFDNARLSLIHAAACFLTFIVFALCKFLNPEKLSRKIGLLFVGALLSFVMLPFIFGFNNVFAPVYDEKIRDYFVPYISEMKPLFLSECPYLVLGSLEILLLYKLFKRKKFAYVSLYVLFFVYLPFAALIRRFLAYEILFYVMITAIFMSELFKRLPTSNKYRWATLGVIVVNLLFSMSFSYAVKPVHTKYPRLHGCALADIFFSPQLIYKTGITTVGSPYHNNIAGITDTVEMFADTDENSVRQKLKQRNVRFVIVPNKIHGIELDYLDKTAENSLYKKLVNGERIDWLKNTGDTDGAYIFYEVIR